MWPPAASSAMASAKRLSAHQRASSPGDLFGERVGVLDVLAVQKDAEGHVSGMEITDFDGDGKNDLLLFEGARSGLLGEEDAANAGQALEPGAMAVMICIENTWAAPFATAVRRNGGQVLAFERVGVQDLLDAAEALDAADAAA